MDLEVTDMSKTKKNSKKAKARGIARARSMTPEQRSESARHAARKRWDGARGEMSLRAETHDGFLSVGPGEIACSVLDDGTRVLTTRGLVRAFGAKQTGSAQSAEDGAPALPAFMASEWIKPFLSEDLIARLRAPIVFNPKRGGRTAFGYEAKILPDVCDAVLDAKNAGKITKQQEGIAKAAEILLRGLSRIGIIALVDEATGYQHDRARDELQKLLAQYIAAELLEWTKRFPNDFFKQVYKIHGWKYQPGITQGPRYVGKFIKKYVYERLPPGVLEELEKKNPAAEGRRKFKHFQWLTEHTGHPHLDNQIVKVTTIMQLSENKGEFTRNFAKAFPEPGQQTDLALPDPNDDDE